MWPSLWRRPVPCNSPGRDTLWTPPRRQRDPCVAARGTPHDATGSGCLPNVGYWPRLVTIAVLDLGGVLCQQREGPGVRAVGQSSPLTPTPPFQAPPPPQAFVPAAVPSNASAAQARAHPPLCARPSRHTRLWSVHAGGRVSHIWGCGGWAACQRARAEACVWWPACRGATVYSALHPLPCTLLVVDAEVTVAGFLTPGASISPAAWCWRPCCPIASVFLFLSAEGSPVVPLIFCGLAASSRRPLGRSPPPP